MIILDIEAPKDCYTCQFVDRDWDNCHVDDSIIAVVDQKGVKHEKCPLKTKEEYLAVAAKTVHDFIEKCEGYTDCITTPDGEKLHSDWGYVEEGLEEIIRWAKGRKENGQPDI